jgi:hypothetical protein
MHRRHSVISSSLGVALVSAALFAGCGGGGDSESTAASTPFAPHATLAAVGGTQRTDKPEIVMRVLARPGDANIRSVAVDLPPVVLVDTGAIDICAKSELESDECAGHSPLGKARVLSPAFEGALTGPVYVVSGSGRLPGLVYLLSGPSSVTLRGKVISKDGRIQAGVDDVPNTPLESFELTIDGGKSGYLVLSTNICQGEPVADGVFTSQDGQTHEQKVPLEAECG